MTRITPSVPAVMAALLGLFMLLAAAGTVVPGFVHDRVPVQFVPVGAWLLGGFVAEPSDRAVMAFARASQAVIAVTELVIGFVMLAAAAMPARRVALTTLGVGLAVGLFGTFMLTMFAMHDKTLPAWNQYPAILAWLAMTWIVVSLAEAKGPTWG